MNVVLFEDRHFSTYGAQQVMVMLAAALADSGWHATVITGREGRLAAHARDRGIAVHIVAASEEINLYGGAALRASALGKLRIARHALRYARALHAAFDELDADIIVANALRPVLYCAATRVFSRRPVVWFLQGGRSYGFLTAVAALIATRIMMVSGGVVRVLPRTIRPLVRHKVWVNSPGLDVVHYASPPFEPAEVRRRFDIPESALVVAGAGRLDHGKGFDVLIEAAARARSNGREIVVVIAGAAADPTGAAAEAALRGQARAAGLPLRMLGWLDDIRELLTVADIFVLSSRVEGLGRVTLEAMAAGLPVIVTRAGGSEETIIDGESGLLVPAGDAEAMAERLSILASDESLRRRLACAGRRRVEEAFTEGAFVDRFMKDARRITPARVREVA